MIINSDALWPPLHSAWYVYLLCVHAWEVQNPWLLMLSIGHGYPRCRVSGSVWNAKQYEPFVSGTVTVP